MTYRILRDGQEFGPYTLADLQRYVDSGRVLLTDLARSEAMDDWTPVSSVLGNIRSDGPAPVSYGHVPEYGAGVQASPDSAYPVPPNLHWALVLLFGVISCGIFIYVWMFVIAAYVKKLDPRSNGVLLYAIGIALIFANIFVSLSVHEQGLAALLQLAGAVLLISGHFSLRSSLEEHFNSAEPVNLQLNGVMTFFFSAIYFQYHLNRIRNWRLTGHM